MTNVAEIVTEVYAKLINGVNQNSAEDVFDALKLMKEEYLACKANATKANTTFELTLKRYIANKGLEQATTHVVGYKEIKIDDARYECVTVSLDDLANYLGEPSRPAVNLLTKNIENNYAQANSMFKYKSEKYHFCKSEQKVGIIAANAA